MIYHECRACAQMLAFVQSQPNIIERILKHVESPALLDFLVRIIQLDEKEEGDNVLEVRGVWSCSSSRHQLIILHSSGFLHKISWDA